MSHASSAEGTQCSGAAHQMFFESCAHRVTRHQRHKNERQHRQKGIVIDKPQLHATMIVYSTQPSSSPLSRPLNVYANATAIAYPALVVQPLLHILYIPTHPNPQHKVIP